MNTITAIFSAIAEMFGFAKKVSKTPEQKEVQAIRKETDEAHKTIDDIVDHGVPPRQP